MPSRVAVVVFTRSAEQDALRWGWGTHGVQARKLLQQRTLRTVGRVADADIHLFHTGDLATPQQQQGGLTPHRQSGHDFGARLSNAVARIRAAGYQRVVVVGTDVPHLRPAHITDAIRKLTAHDLVLGGDVAGGCYLIGIDLTRNNFDPAVLRSVSWHQGTDFAELASLSQAGMHVGVLTDVLHDLDEVSALRALPNSGLTARLWQCLARIAQGLSRAPVTVPARQSTCVCRGDDAVRSPHRGRGPPAWPSLVTPLLAA